jgi:hypothetical protein
MRTRCQASHHGKAPKKAELVPTRHVTKCHSEEDWWASGMAARSSLDILAERIPSASAIKIGTLFQAHQELGT